MRYLDLFKVLINVEVLALKLTVFEHLNLLQDREFWFKKPYFYIEYFMYVLYVK